MYKNEKQEKESNKKRVEDEEVILIKLYEVSGLTSSSKSSFIDNKVNNLIKYEVHLFLHTDKTVSTTPILSITQI